MKTNDLMRKKEAEILAEIGTGCRSIRALYNQATGRDRALMRAGVWLADTRRLPQVAEDGIKNSQGAAKYLRPFYDNIAGEEQIVALLLNSQNRPITIIDCTAASGPAGVNLGIRHLVKEAMTENAAAVILSHNHPSGELEPSREDVNMTRDLSRLLEAMKIDLIDHVLLVPNGEYRRISWVA